MKNFVSRFSLIFSILLISFTSHGVLFAVSASNSIPDRLKFSFQLKEYDDTYEISAGSLFTDTIITIPSIYKGKNISSIKESAFQDCTDLTNVTIGSGVTSIGSSAFRDCTALTYVTIGSGVTSIDKEAFSNCKSLRSITIPDSVTSIEDSAFENCTAIITYR
jgi:hypothetical protein